MKKFIYRILFISVLFWGASWNSFSVSANEDFPEANGMGIVMWHDVTIEGHHYEDIKFYQDAGERYIRIIAARTKENTLVFPSKIKNWPVTKILDGGGYVGYGEYFGHGKDVEENQRWHMEKGQKYKAVIVPEGVEEVCFNNMRTKRLELPKSLKDLWGCNDNTEIDHVVIKGKKLNIEHSPFARSKVKKVTLPKNYEGKIGMGAFEESAIESFTWPSYKSGASKKIGHGIFKNCKKLKKVVFPKKQAHIYIPNSTFYGCTKLKKLTFPASTKKVTYRWHAYAENYKMGPQTLEFKGKKTKLAGAAFEYTRYKKTLLTVSKVIVPPKSKALAYVKKAKKIKSFSRTTKWRMKEHESVEHNYADEDGDGVLKLTKLKYVIRK